MTSWIIIVKQLENYKILFIPNQIYVFIMKLSFNSILKMIFKEKAD